jgi:uncharacterized protein (DUF1778 family)
VSDETMGRIHYEIPDEVHRDAKAAAGVEGLTLKDFLIEALRERAQEVLRRRAGEIDRKGKG